MNRIVPNDIIPTDPLRDKATPMTDAIAVKHTGEWQDISTAPKDGTYILVHQTDVFEPSDTVVAWDTDWWMLCDGKDPFIALRGPEPTHWMPLPPPPPPPSPAQKVTTMSDVSERVELLPCPFCGTMPFVQNAGWMANTFVRCPGCSTTFSVDKGSRPHTETVAAWNRRSPTLAADRVVGVKDAPEAVALIDSMSDEEFGRDRSNENPNVGKLATPPEPKPAAVVDDAQIEAVAKAIYEFGVHPSLYGWEKADEGERQNARDYALVALRAVKPSIAREAIPRSEWGCELWEILFGLLKGEVPDELTDEVLQRLAEDFVSALSSKDNGDGK